ncbi:MAG: peptide ABC transporter substrate-binding protein [Roseiflexaceae bacterium]
MPKYALFQRVALCLLLVSLVACEVEGGVERPTPPPAAATDAPLDPTPMPTSAAVADAIQARRDTWVVGLLDVPPDLYPYPSGPAAARALAPINELLFPSPVLAINYTYTTTGVLERIPTFENGDAVITQADVYLDAAGTITTTVTDIITQVNQIEVTFRWNKQLRWSDGTPVTANDSLFAYELAKAAPPSNEAFLLLDQIASYEVIDEHTTRATLKPDITGQTYFLSYWTPLPRHLLEGVDPATLRSSPFARQPLGYGPYQIEQIMPGEIRLVRNPYYFGPPPRAERVTFLFLRDLDAIRANFANGNLDLAVTDRLTPDLLLDLQQLADDGVVIDYSANPIWEHIDFNLDVPILQDIRVRRAIAFGTNRQRMIDLLYNGQTNLLESWVLPDQAEAAPLDQITRYPYNPEEARKLLEEAGYTDPDGDGIRASQEMTLTLQLFTSDGPIRERTAALFQEDMRAIGIDIELITLTTGELFSPDGPLFQRQFELGLYAWVAGPDPGGLLLWSCLAVPSENNRWQGDNFAGWCFRDADRAIREATTTLDPQVRRDAYIRQQQLWTQEVPSLPLFQRASVAMMTTDVIGAQLDPLAPITWNIQQWQRQPEQR